MSKLPLEVKEKWLTALRSGEYEQTTQSLKNDGRYCCLGVLTDILIKDKIISGEWFGSCYDGKFINNEGEEENDWADQYLPVMACQKINLSEDPEVLIKEQDRERLKLICFHEHRYSGLSTLNDNGFSFEEIAQYIEEQL